MIDLTRPSFIAHHTEGDLVVQYLTDLAGDAGRDWYGGASLHLPRWKVSTQLNAVNRLVPETEFVVADPDTRRSHLPFDGRGRARDELQYLGESTPRVNRQRYVDWTLEAQAANGRDILISPWLIHGLTPGDDRELRATIDFSERATQHPLAGDRQLLMGLEATEGVIADQQLRDSLLDELMANESELPVYFRMTIDPPESRRPYGEEDALRGLRSFCEGLQQNGRQVLLPQSGPVGWLMLPFGAVSFGAGTTSAMERNLRPSHRSGGGGGAPPLHWYFSLDLLGPVLAEELPRLQHEGLPACLCPYCQASPPRGGAAFNANQAALHYLWCCGLLADEIRRAQDAAAEVRTRVANAQALWAQVRTAGVQMDSRSRENHLAAWSAAIS